MADIDISSIGTKQFHIDAQDTDSETLSGSLLTAYADKGGNSLGNWTPNSGRNPVVTTVDGKRGYNFTGSKNLKLDTALLKALDALTVVAVVSPTNKYLNASSVGQVFGTLFSLGRTDIGQLIFGNTSSLIVLETTAISHWSGSQQKAAGTATADFGWFENDTMMLTQTVGDQGSKTYRGNQELDTSLASAGALLDDDFSPAHLSITNNTAMIGGILLNSGGTVGANGLFVLHELIGFGKYLTDADKELLQAYVTKKWDEQSYEKCMVVSFEGQSNARGRAVIADAPASYQDEVANAYSWPVAYLDFHTTATSLADTGLFGMDVPMIHALPDRIGGKPAVLVKQAINATALGDYWLPPDGTGSNDFDTKFTSAFNGLKGHGLVPDEFVHIFMGTESDMLNESFADAVKANLKTMQDYMESDNNMGRDLLFIVVTPPSGTGYAYSQTVLDMIADFGLENTESVVVIPTDDLPTLNGDPIHWGNSAMDSIATRCNDAIVAWRRNKSLQRLFPIAFNGKISVSQLPADTHSNGLPFEKGQLAVLHGTTAPDQVVNGWPFDSGRIAVEIGGTASTHQNGLPLTSAGRIAMNSSQDVDGNQNGLPFANGGIAIT